MEALKKHLRPYVQPLYDFRTKIVRSITPKPAPQCPDWRYTNLLSDIDPGIKAIANAQRNITSQFGEDGIILYLLEKLGLTARTCLEVGAWDGKHFSNTWNLIENHGWRGVLIEVDKERFAELPNAYSAPEKNIYINELVGFKAPYSMDYLLEKHGFSGTMDLMSIDIDGDDWHVLNAIEKFLPNILVIEYNRSVPNHVFFVQALNSPRPTGSSLAAFAELGRQKGYQMVFATPTNAILVKNELFPLLGIQNNALDQINPNPAAYPVLIEGYDGTIYVAGRDRKIWQDESVVDSEIISLTTLTR